MAAPPAVVVVPSATITHLGLHFGSGETSAFARKQISLHPEWRLEDDEKVDWSNFRGSVLNASYCTLPTLGQIAAAAPTFTRLTILCLRESGVVDIELLRPCAMLVHLDLSSNEIVDLVDGDFWGSFRDLLILLLHGNKVIEWRAVGGLGKAPRLTYLTLFFNPVCKRNMYRPFTTNCCESLRGLDLHAVSDEEVVEGAIFFKASRFGTCSSALALPQPLFRGLTELALSPTQGEVHDIGHHPVHRASDSDAAILGRVLRRVQLLRKFHARNSPVVIGQRQIRRFLGKRFGVSAAVKIQTIVRRWLVELRSVVALRDILRKSGELYLVQEMLTPMQLRSLTWFQRHITGHFRMKVLITCAKAIEGFMGKVAKHFSAFVDGLEAAQVGGIVVGQDQSGDLAAAVARALIVTVPGLTWVEAAERTATMVTVVPDCRLLRPFSYVDMPDWPILKEDIDTDGVFVTRSVAGFGSSAPERGEIGPRIPRVAGAATPRPLSGLREASPPRARVRHRMGVFGSPRVTRCIVSRRSSVSREWRRDVAAAAATAKRRRRTSTAAHEQLWVFRPPQIRVLARVLCTLRNGAGKPPVPFVLERHLIRCASATRIQAAWRGRVVRWVLLDALASCIIVARAGVCVQRWWRHQRGLSTRLRLCRRLWALASDVSSPTMYVELDVFFALTRGWRFAGGEDGSVVFTFQDGDKVAVVRGAEGLPFGGALDSGTTKHAEQGETKTRKRNHGDASRKKMPITRELPMWALGSVVRHVPPSEVHHGEALTELGALLTVGVKAKKVVWPLSPAATTASEPDEDVMGVNGIVIRTSPCQQLDRNRDETSSDSLSTSIRLASARSEETGGQAHPPSVLQGTAPAVAGRPVDLRNSHRREMELLELTFSSAQEARARAVVLALGTEEPGRRPNRPIAPLMTLEMLRRAAAGELGRAAPTLRTPARGFRRGDAVEVSVFRLSEGRGGAWFPAIVDRVDGRTYQVTLENGLGQHRVPQGSTRPRDRTGKEPALVEMSHLPSRWQRNVRSRLTPEDRLELELLRRSLPATTPAVSSLAGSPVQLLSGKPQQGADALAPTDDDDDDPRRLDGLDGRGLVLVEPRPVSPGSPLRRSGRGVLAPSPPRWVSSQTMATVRTAGGLAAEAMEKVARAAAAADEAATASTWVPGNRFRMGLERLVHLDARELRGAAEKAGLSARRDTVSRARQAARAEPSPRDRLERLKAAEAAIFRRESDEISHKAAFEKAIHKHELRINAVEAREYMRESRKHVAEALETELANKMADSRRRDGEAEGERRRSLEKRQADVQAAKARAAKRREGRTKQTLTLAESRAFTANASQLARHVGKHASASYKVQNARGMRQWVKGQKLHKEDMRRRMLRRVQELQEQNRNEGTRLRRALAARGRARAAIDEAIIHHRAGHTAVPPGDDNLAEEIMHVLRPRSRLQGANSGQDDGEPGSLCEEDDGGARGDGTHDVGTLDTAQPQSPVETGQHAVAHRRPPGDNGARGGAIPCKPEAARLLRSRGQRGQRNRCLSAGGGDGGKTVVVLASVPRVTREVRSTRPPQGPTALLVSPSKEAVRVVPDPAALPWPLGRRCW